MKEEIVSLPGTPNAPEHSSAGGHSYISFIFTPKDNKGRIICTITVYDCQSPSIVALLKDAAAHSRTIQVYGRMIGKQMTVTKLHHSELGEFEFTQSLIQRA